MSSDAAANARLLGFAFTQFALPVVAGPTLDFHDVEGERQIVPQHYAFLISEPDFDRVLGKIKAAGLEHWADPARRRPGEINHNDGGRGVYFPDPDGHFLEVITRPYGSGG